VRKLRKNSYFEQAIARGATLQSSNCCFLKEFPTYEHGRAWYNATKKSRCFFAMDRVLISPPRSRRPMSAHALASAALNAFILESNRGGDLQAAYNCKVLEGHCVNKSTRGFVVQTVTLMSTGSAEVGGGRNYPENMHDM
jgi:hypothetical protein